MKLVENWLLLLWWNIATMLFVKCDEPDNIVKMVTAANYPIEKYTVQTEDNYILAVYRIPASPKSAKKANREAVLLIHGLLLSAVDYIVSGPKKALAYKLADAGYDVWLGNTRGNTWSRIHESHSPESNEFWNFSWHDSGIYDIPAIIDFALKKSGQSKLHLVGHSQGATIICVALTELPMYNDRVHMAFLLAPAIFVNHPSPFVEWASINSNGIVNALKTFGFNEIFPWRPFLQSAATMLCAVELDTHLICRDALFAFYGRTPEQYNASLMLTVAENTPSGGSRKAFEHYFQLFHSGKFQKFDYLENNMKVYAQAAPPEYDLSKISTNVHVFYGEDDIIITKEDAIQAIEKLGKSVASKTPLAGFNHIDFMWGNTADKLVYDKIIEKMNKQ